MPRASFKLITGKDLKEEKNRLWNLNDSQSDLVSMATHQIKTPLSGIKWTLRMLLSGEFGGLTDEQKSWLQSSYDSNERVLSLIDEMLESIRVDEDRLEIEKREENIIEIINDTIEDLKLFIKKKKLHINFNSVPNAKNIAANVDRGKIRIAIQNIVENSIRYSREGGRIDIDVVKETGDIKVSIKDYGIGIPEAEKKDIFSRFFRASNALRKMKNGSGLGLFISRGIIEKHGGKIWFESSQDRGTTFYFIIPTT